MSISIKFPSSVERNQVLDLLNQNGFDQNVRQENSDTYIHLDSVPNTKFTGNNEQEAISEVVIVLGKIPHA